MHSTRSPTPRKSVANLPLNSVNVQVRSASTGSKKRKTSMPQCRVCFNGYNTSEPAPAVTPPPAGAQPLLSQTGRTRPMVTSKQGRRGSKCPFSASFDRRAPPLFPPLPSPSSPLPPSYTTRPPGARCARWEGQGFRIAHHVTVVPRRIHKKRL